MFKTTTVCATLAAVVSVLAAAPAMAEAPRQFGDASDWRYPAPATSTVTRAEVRAELRSARAAGWTAPSEGSDSIVSPQTQRAQQANQGAGKPRAQVKAETLEAVRVHATGQHERNEFPSAAQLRSIEQAGLKAVGGSAGKS